MERGAKKVRVHVLTDGRDVPDGSSIQFVTQLEEFLAGVNKDHVSALSECLCYVSYLGTAVKADAVLQGQMTRIWPHQCLLFPNFCPCLFYLRPSHRVWTARSHLAVAA